MVRIVCRRWQVFSCAEGPDKYSGGAGEPLVDTWGLHCRPAHSALSENNLYTSDAFYDYLSHLTDDGRTGIHPLGDSIRPRRVSPTGDSGHGCAEAFR